MRNFSIDWEKPYLLELEVMRSRPGDTELRVADGFDYLVEDGGLYFLPEDGKKYPCDRANGFDAGRTLLFGARSSFTFSGIVTREYPSPYPRAARRPSDPRVGDLGDRRVRIIARDLPEVPVGGRIVYMTLTARGHRLFPGVVIDRGRGVHLGKVRIHSAFGMALVAQFSCDISLSGCEVVPADGRVASTRADAAHFNQCAGKITVEDCRFEGMLDDALNIHGMWVRVKSVRGAGAVVARIHIQQETVPFAEPGDRLEIRTPALKIKGTAVVQTAVENSPTDSAVEFTGPFAGLEPGDVIQNLSRQAELVVRRCIVRETAGRGFLISTRGRVMVEDNDISTPLGPAILLPGEVGRWGESGPVHDVAIRHNRFVNCATVSPTPVPVVLIRPDVEKKFGPFHKNIKIENNEFVSPHPRLIELRHAANVIVRGNVFSVAGQRAEWKSVVTTDDCERVALEP